jgi:hypothetical protein
MCPIQIHSHVVMYVLKISNSIIDGVMKDTFWPCDF